MMPLVKGFRVASPWGSHSAFWLRLQSRKKCSKELVDIHCPLQLSVIGKDCELERALCQVVKVRSNSRIVRLIYRSEPIEFVLQPQFRLA